MLASRFVAGLKPKLLERLTGAEGSFEELLSRARFEEAKRRELQLDKSMGASTIATTRGRDSQQDSSRGGKTCGRGPSSEVLCYICEGKGHYARECPLKGRARDRETTGRQERVKGLTAVGEDRLEKELTVLTLGVQTPVTRPVLGPRIEVPETVRVTALVDTGSPVSILSSTCFFRYDTGGRGLES